MKKEGVGILQVILAQAIIAFISILVRFGKSFGVYNLSFSRVFLTAVFIYLIFSNVKRYKIVGLKKEKKKLIFFGALHGILVAASYLAVLLLSIASYTILALSLSVWMVIFSHFILHEKIKSKTFIGIIIAFVGLIIITSPTSYFFKENIVGISAGLFVGVGGGLIYVLSKTFKSYDPVSLTFWQNLIATPVLIPLLFIQLPKFSFMNNIIVILLGLCGALSFILIFSGFRKIQGQIGGALVLTNIIFAVIFAFIFLGEVPSKSEIVGGLMIILGSLIVSRNN